MSLESAGSLTILICSHVYALSNVSPKVALSGVTSLIITFLGGRLDLRDARGLMRISNHSCLGLLKPQAGSRATQPAGRRQTKRSERVSDAGLSRFYSPPDKLNA
jgi:hypothetical protein